LPLLGAVTTAQSCARSGEIFFSGRKLREQLSEQTSCKRDAISLPARYRKRERRQREKIKEGVHRHGTRIEPRHS